MRLPLSLVAVALVAGGCNVFEGAYDSVVPKTNDPVVLIRDGAAAMDQNRPADAVKILEKAVEKAPEGTLVKDEARVNLATATLQANGLTVLDFEGFVTDLTAEFDGAAGKGATSCAAKSFPNDHTMGGVVDLNGVPGYAEIGSKIAVLKGVRVLLAKALGLSESPTADEVVAAVARLRARGASDRIVEAALLNAALAYLATAYDSILAAGGRDLTWVRVTPPGGASYVGYCAPSQGTVDGAKAAVKASMGPIGASVTMLELRAAAYPNSVGSTLVDKARDAYEKLRAELDGAAG